MSYNKTKWINDQTKLSATNFNHMENGIEEAHILVEEVGLQAQRALHTALEAKEEIENIDLSSKQDVLESGVNIKTINGKSILGEGDLPIEEGESVNYQELTDVSLDDLVDTGIYYITNARDIPTGTSTEGTLKVQKLSDEKVEQEWKSTTNTAQRILVDGASAGNKFYVNNVERTQGEITLPAGDTYELRGNLQGNIIIEGTANNRTKLILNGVNIQSSLVDSIINYTPDSSKLVIEIANGTENYLVVDKDEETGDNDVGVINSNNNLMITGVGYLSIVNGKGHGIKASELIIDGEAHIYLDTNHDAIHGGKLLKISGGYFVVNNANDAFSASEGGSDTGKLLIYGGTYDIRACKEAAFEGKSANGIKRVLNANITLGAGVNKLFNASRASSSAYQVKVYQGLNTITNNSGKEYSEVDMADDFEGEPTIIYAGEVNVPSVSGVFTLTQPGTYTLKGNFSNYKIISNPPAGDNKMNLILDNVYYNNEEELDPFINHLSADKRIKFDNKEDNFTGKLCFIRKTQGNIIQSASNVQFDGKTDVIIKGGSGCGISAPNGYVLLANDTIRSISGCLYGIEADNVRLGKDLEDVADGKYATSDTAIYIQGNGIDIKSNSQTGAFDPYYDHASVVAPQYHTGIAIISSVVPGNITIEAQEGQITGAGYTNKAIVYVESDTGTQININRYTALSGVKEEIPSIEPGETSPWNVYKGDGYSKEEADAEFVSRAAYNALLAELNERAPKTISIINYVEDSTKTDHRPAKDHAYCPVEIDGETVRVVDAVEIFRYACPERIDIDDTPETHGDYVKDSRPMYARDGDFGYPEIDRTGQFNFRPVWNTEDYVIIPEGITPADGYNNFKTQWNTGIPGLYRFTKVNSDLTLDLHAVKEADMPAHILTYKIMAPADQSIENLPQVRVFRGADHCEKFMKYGPGTAHPKAHPELSEALISGNLLEITGEPTVEVIDGVSYNVWTILDKAYDDGNGLPSADTGDKTNAKVYFNVSGTPAEGYAYQVDAKKVGNNFNKFNNPTAEKNYYTLTKVQGNIEVTIKVVPDVPDITLTFVNNAGYDIENTAESGALITEPIIINGLKDFQFKVVHNLNNKDKEHTSAIAAVTVNGVSGTVLETSDLEGADATVVWKLGKNKDECRIKKAYIPTDAEGTIVITINTATIID